MVTSHSSCLATKAIIKSNDFLVLLLYRSRRILVMKSFRKTWTITLKNPRNWYVCLDESFRCIFSGTDAFLQCTRYAYMFVCLFIYFLLVCVCFVV